MGEKKLVRRSVAIVLGVLCIIILGGMVGAVIYYNNAYSNYASSHNHTDSDYKSVASELAAANANISSLNSQVSTLQSELSSGTSPTQSNLEAQIASLTSQLAAAQTNLTANKYYYEGIEYVENTQISDLTNQLAAANNQTAIFQNQVNSLNATLGLQLSATWVNNQTVSQSAGSYTDWTESANYAGYVSITVSSSTTASTYANLVYSAYGVNYNQTINVGLSGTAYFPVLPSTNIFVAIGNQLPSGTATETVTITYYY